MAWFTTNSISGRFRVAFGSFFLALAMVGGIGLYQANQLNDAANDLAFDRLPSVVALGHLEEATARYRQLQASIVLAPDADLRARLVEYQSKTRDDIQSSWQAYQPLVDPGEER